MSLFIDQSQVCDKLNNDDHTKVDVVDDKEEEESLVDHMVNDDSVDHMHEPFLRAMYIIFLIT